MNLTKNFRDLLEKTQNSITLAKTLKTETDMGKQGLFQKISEFRRRF